MFVGSALVPTVEGLTIARIRGYFEARLTLATAANDGFSGAFGIGIASAAAVALGVNGLPTPLTEQGAENWLYWQAFSVFGAQAYSAGGAPGMEQHGTYFRTEIDTKAMRKFPSDLALYACAEFVEVGIATMDVWHDSRALVFLP